MMRQGRRCNIKLRVKVANTAAEHFIAGTVSARCAAAGQNVVYFQTVVICQCFEYIDKVSRFVISIVRHVSNYSTVEKMMQVSFYGIMIRENPTPMKFYTM